MKKFKTIGVLGGMGPAASAHFYNLLIKKSQEIYGAVQDDEYPQIIINSLALSGSSEEGMENDSLITTQLIDGIKILEKAGADFVVIPCNSVHNSIELMRENTKLPIVGIIESVSKKVIKDKVKKVLILSSESSKKYGLYDGLTEKGVKVIKPNAYLSKKVTKLILSVMGNNKVSEAKKIVVSKMNELFKTQKADSVILGCTELPLAINKNDTRANIYDSLDILADSALHFAKND